MANDSLATCDLFGTSVFYASATYRNMKVGMYRNGINVHINIFLILLSDHNKYSKYVRYDTIRSKIP